jgi:DNA-binding transcriptional MerR regulator
MSGSGSGTGGRVQDARAYLSIGEVLGLLLKEFPDVTISKIRFLESQGLIDPERTASGYRKFYEPDIERLRFILREQREHFLPLRVIKDRLASGEPSEETGPDDGPTGADPEPSERRAAADQATMQAASDALFSFDELAAASGLGVDGLTEVVRFGLVSGRNVGGDVVFDGDALLAAKAAAAFLRYGVEARHLRTYRTAADREAGLMEQVIMPLVKQRNPEARVRAAETLDALWRLGGDLRDAMLRQSMRPYREGN